MRIAQALDRARERGVARLDAQILLARCLEQTRVWLIAHDQDPIAPGQPPVADTELDLQSKRLRVATRHLERGHAGVGRAEPGARLAVLQRQRDGAAAGAQIEDFGHR